ncbi:hypothetical protein, partial [Gordonia sp. (in: high G+C Gram-positive bacteria)]|uniref:hypothetical protein n=1 Tax=Gordonia sp. (in: high G+C Gram-positive bacteria) TaxID=84139 RepID=UPI0039E3EDB9
RTATRGVLRADRVPEDRARPVRLLVDASASMAGLYASGMVAAAADIVAGLASIVSGTPEVTVGSAGPGAAAPVPITADRVGATLAAAPVGGFALSGGLVVPPAPGTLTVLLTDGPQAAPLGDDQVLLVLSDSSAADRSGFRGAILAPLADAANALAAQPAQIARVVAALLEPFALAGGAR